MHTDPKRGLGRSPNGGLGGQSPPTVKPSNKRIKSIVGLRSRCNYCARFMCMLFPKLMHTHQYFWYLQIWIFISRFEGIGIKKQILKVTIRKKLPHSRRILKVNMLCLDFSIMNTCK